MISRCRATIEPGTPIVRDGRDNYVRAECGLFAPTPPMWGPGRPSHAGRGTILPVGRQGAEGRAECVNLLNGPPYAGGRDAPPPSGGAPIIAR